MYSNNFSCTQTISHVLKQFLMYSNNFSCTQFPAPLEPELRYRVHSSSTLVRILSQMSPVDTSQSSPLHHFLSHLPHIVVSSRSVYNDH